MWKKRVKVLGRPAFEDEEEAGGGEEGEEQPGPSAITTADALAKVRASFPFPFAAVRGD